MDCVVDSLRLTPVSRHMLTNVGRVAARDSSRANATVNDLFTALCEDDSIYGLFKSMRGVYFITAVFFFSSFSQVSSGLLVYERIELLSKIPIKTRRSKSFTRSDASNTLNSRTSSPLESLPTKESFTISRSSSELTSTLPHTAVVMAASSRTSLDRSRSVKFKNSLESESMIGPHGHKKSESFFNEKMMDDEQSLAEVSGGKP